MLEYCPRIRQIPARKMRSLCRQLLTRRVKTNRSSNSLHRRARRRKGKISSILRICKECRHLRWIQMWWVHWAIRYNRHKYSSNLRSEQLSLVWASPLRTETARKTKLGTSTAIKLSITTLSTKTSTWLKILIPNRINRQVSWSPGPATAHKCLSLRPWWVKPLQTPLALPAQLLTTSMP
jgi:hypothetical protein